MITSYISKSFQNSSNIISSTSTITDTGLITVVDSVAGGGNITVAVPYDASAASAVYVQCDQDDTTFNPTAGTSTTLNFTDATCPYTWQLADQYANIWGDDFTAILVTNGSATDTCNFTIYVSYTV